jgi:ketosteroid isomerase-like protein
VSQENVEIVRRIYEAAAGRKAEVIFELYHPEVELDATRLGISDLDIYHGHDGLRRLFGEFSEVFGKIEYSYDELIDAGEQVVSIVTRHAQGRTSGADVERPFALLWTVREGKVVRVVWFLTRDDVMEAAGLAH